MAAMTESTEDSTSLMDVLLVLLVMFTVIVPAVPRVEAASVPGPKLERAMARPDAVVLEVQAGTGSAILLRTNQQPVSVHQPESRLAKICANRAQRSLLIKGNEGQNFSERVNSIGIGDLADVDSISFTTAGVAAVRQ